MLDTLKVSPKGPDSSQPMQFLKPVRTVANHRAGAVMRGYWGARDMRREIGPLARRALVVPRGDVEVHGTIATRMLRRLDEAGREIFIEIHADSSATILRGLAPARDDLSPYQPLLVCPIVLQLSSASVTIGDRKILLKVQKPGRHARVFLPTLHSYAAATRAVLGAVDAEGGDPLSRAVLDILFAEAAAWMAHAESLPALTVPEREEDHPCETEAGETLAPVLGIAPGDPVAVPLFLPFLTVRVERTHAMKAAATDIAAWALDRRSDLERIDIQIRAGRPRQTGPFPPAVVGASVVRGGVCDAAASQALSKIVRAILAEDCGGLPLRDIQGQERAPGNRDVLQEIPLVYTSTLAGGDMSAHHRIALAARFAAHEPALRGIQA